MGKFKALIPPKEYKRLLKKVRDGETEQDNVPSDDDSPFDPRFGFWSGLMETIPCQALRS
jgi:hypothetical protein